MKKGVKVIGSIYESTDYSEFKKLENNRDVLEGRFKKLVASFSVKSILNPIIVNKEMEIIDGQGRFEARKSLGLPIQYIIEPGADIEDCKLMNRYNTKWSNLDFAKSYAQGGNKNYINLLKACADTGLGITIVMRLANHTSSSKKEAQFNILASGKLLFNEADIEKVVDTWATAEDIKQALLYPGRLNDAFYTSVSIMMQSGSYVHKRMIENCKVTRTDYAQASNISAQLKEFERIYNYRKPAASRVYFTDYMRNKGYEIKEYQTQPSPYDEKDVSTLRRK